MKRFIIFAVTLLLVISLPICVSAEDVAEVTVGDETTITDDTTAETAAESLTEAEEVTKAQTNEDTENAAETETDELSAMLDVATPEQIELMKQYMLYGIKSLPVSERVKLFLLDHLNALMWAFAAAALLIFSVSNRMTSKKHTDEAATMTSNAIELAEIGQNSMDEAQTKMQSIERQCAEMMERVNSDMDNRMKENAKTMAEFMENAMNRLESILQSANNAMHDTSDREKSLTEALLLNEEITAYMIENSALPEVERDRMAKISKKIAAQLREVEKEVSGNEEA